MTLQEIDQALNAWSNRLAAIAENLLELQAESTYQLLTGKGGAVKLQLAGATKARVEPALGAMLNIFQNYEALHSTIQRAAKLRENLPKLFGADEKLREIRHLLFERCIELPEVDLPLEQRTLLSGLEAVSRVSADELLAAMTRTFAAARDAVLAVDAAWHDLAARIEATEAKIRGAKAEIARVASDLQTAEMMLDAARAKVQADPLGALADLDTRVEPMLARVNKAVETAGKVRKELLDAWMKYDELVRSHRDALAAAAEAREKILDCAGLKAPISDEKVAGFREWLDRLDRKLTEGAVDAVSVGVRSWQAAAKEAAGQDKSAATACRAAIAARLELRGRLEALKAKARAYGVAEGDAFAEVAGKAETLLYARPTDLNRAADSVVAYERMLSGMKREA
jgi:chromosome segregation ATPase